MTTALGRVLSLDVGRERPVAAEGGTSGIDERPVSGPVAVRAPGPESGGGSGLAGDAVEVLDSPAHGVTVATAFAAVTTEPDLLPLLADVPELPASDRERIERRLAEGS